MGGKYEVCLSLGTWLTPQPRGLTDHPSIKVLHSTSLSNVACHPEVQQDVVQVGVLVRLKAPQNNKASPFMNNLRYLLETSAQARKWEGVSVDLGRTKVPWKVFVRFVVSVLTSILSWALKVHG